MLTENVLVAMLERCKPGGSSTMTSARLSNDCRARRIMANANVNRCTPGVRAAGMNQSTTVANRSSGNQFNETLV
jgi:hypothetical protein